MMKQRVEIRLDWWRKLTSSKRPILKNNRRKIYQTMIVTATPARRDWIESFIKIEKVMVGIQRLRASYKPNLIMFHRASRSSTQITLIYIHQLRGSIQTWLVIYSMSRHLRRKASWASYRSIKIISMTRISLKVSYIMELTVKAFSSIIRST